MGGLGVTRGASVLVPAYSCVALANAVLACGAIPVSVDVKSADWNIDPACATEAVGSSAARAIVAVHTFGVPAAVVKLKDLGVPVIEDCAHALGIDADGWRLGAGTDAAVVSLYATKLVGAGEGGAVLTDDAEVATFVREMRDYVDRSPGARFNDKMTDLEASLGLVQLKRLPDMIAAREVLAQRYDERLRGIDGLTLPDPARHRVWYRYAIEMTRLSAVEAVRRLRSYGVNAAEPVSDWRGPGIACPIASHAYHALVSLPLYPTLTEDEQDRVVHAVHRSMRECDQV
jgi:dTDP-4-amino-4,6-dideoxygalactose transaminase